MKMDIHPTYYSDAKITCACGNVIDVGSTQQDIHVELCSACHPFYTGQQKFVDTSGRIEKYHAKVLAHAARVGVFTGKKVKTAKRAIQKASKKATKQSESLSVPM